MPTEIHTCHSYIRCAVHLQARINHTTQFYRKHCVGPCFVIVARNIRPKPILDLSISGLLCSWLELTNEELP